LQLSEDQRKAFACHEVGQLFPEYYLIKIKSFADITTDTLDEWIYFLRNSDILPSFKARGLQMSREERAAYDDYIENLRFQNSVSRTQLEDLEQARKDAEIAKAEAQQAQAESEAAKAETQAMSAKAIAALVAAGLTDEQARASLGC
jgi:alpha-galactosidase/6-phospho-beta-glucosidase family protein